MKHEDYFGEQVGELGFRYLPGGGRSALGSIDKFKNKFYQNLNLSKEESKALKCYRLVKKEIG